ncbi:hypothetical protein PISMIDRAFT_13874 [Pisolithus microcarpus 441]|uniref:Uncharacterized protein n=1 Tax=Pisolithus microcarpus 441 TaxID=765257 RepID=A0A0C9Y396_9AGAM|nr:hypothetical protein BKA83DRAFT_13874 [Pisolithus microcarpus]KIK19185.1 hypothetical protein PISMIDRAFT_13874 [Pisolithus microcarpus 441]
MSGLWQGCLLLADDTAMETLFQIPHMPTNFSEQNLGVMPIPAGEMEDGRHDAWLSLSTQCFKYGNKLALSYATPDPLAPHHCVKMTRT